jgi:ribosomal protein S12 methylthiotransferase
VAGSFWIETLGCPKNQVDSDKLAGTLHGEGMVPAVAPDDAELVVVNTCAFIEEARQESVDTILALSDARADGARVVVTGCLAERAGDELAAALPEVDQVAGFGVPFTDGQRRAATATTTAAVPVTLGARRPGRSADVAGFDLLRLPRPASDAPWAYVKVAEGCDRACGFCAIPTFRGPQRSRPVDEVIGEVDALGVREAVLVAQDLAAYGRDQGVGERALVPLVRRLTDLVDRVRLLYLYPSDLTDELVDAVLSTGVPYFDLSLQHVSPPLMRRMRRWGDGDRFLDRIAAIRSAEPGAAMRSSFIVGYPGETEADHDRLLAFLAEAQLDWVGFFAYSAEDGTYAAGLDGVVPRELMDERLREVRELQDAITARRRDELIGDVVEVLVDRPGEARSWREAPEIDGIVTVPEDLAAGTLLDVRVVDALGPDLVAVPVAAGSGAVSAEPVLGGAA